jgi:hypothetical protein
MYHCLILEKFVLSNGSSVSHFSKENESKLLDLFLDSANYEILIVDTILDSMMLYQRGLKVELTSSADQAKKYFNKLYSTLKKLDLKKAKWLRSIDRIRQFALSYSLQDDEIVNSTLFEPAGFPFEGFVRSCISKFESLLDEEDYIKFEENRTKCDTVLDAWRKAKKGWETILALRILLLQMGVNDFFELFDGKP